MIPSQKQLAASICIQFGEYYLAEKEYAKAVRSYKDALSYSPIDNKVGSSKPDLAPGLGAQCPSKLSDQGRGQFLLCASLRSSGVRAWDPGCEEPALAAPGPLHPEARLEGPFQQPVVEGGVGKTLLKFVLVWRLQIPGGGGETMRGWLPGTLGMKPRLSPGRSGVVRELRLQLGSGGRAPAKRINGKLSDKPVHPLNVDSSSRFLIHAQYYTRPWRHSEARPGPCP